MARKAVFPSAEKFLTLVSLSQNGWPGVLTMRSCTKEKRRRVLENVLTPLPLKQR